jgi:hypothetical protein
MTTLSTLLRAGDPLASEPDLGTAEVERIRRAVLNAARPNRPPVARTSLLLAAAIAIAAAALWDQRQAPQSVELAAPVRVLDVAGAVDRTGRRQLQFATPGGTRVIWVFDTGFDSR